LILDPIRTIRTPPLCFTFTPPYLSSPFFSAVSLRSFRGSSCALVFPYGLCFLFSLCFVVRFTLVGEILFFFSLGFVLMSLLFVCVICIFSFLVFLWLVVFVFVRDDSILGALAHGCQPR